MRIKKENKLIGMNIELTTVCPLRCPQCYCSLDGGKHIPLETARNYLRQAKKLGLEHVELSGGETLCYPHLCELVQEAHSLGIQSNIAISGWHFNEHTLKKLVSSGLNRIFVSLNAPTEPGNSKSRNGYEYAISALELLKDSSFQEVYINWVMHRDTADTLPEMIELAHYYNVKAIVILTPKPTSQHELNSLPNTEQMQRTVQLIRNKYGSLVVESCFSPLLALAMDTSFLGNLNSSIYKGCNAGYSTLSVNVDGMLSPCRHLDYFEEWDSLEDYWVNSPVLKKIRSLEGTKREPCLSCKYGDYCRHCLAINSKLNNDLYIGNACCPLAVGSPTS